MFQSVSDGLDPSWEDIDEGATGHDQRYFTKMSELGQVLWRVKNVAFAINFEICQVRKLLKCHKYIGGKRAVASPSTGAEVYTTC